MPSPYTATPMATVTSRPAPAPRQSERGWLRSWPTALAWHVLAAAGAAYASHSLTAPARNFHTVLAPYLTAAAAAVGLGASSLLAWWCWLAATPPGVLAGSRTWLWPLAALATLFLGICGWGFSWFLAAAAGC